MRVLCLVWNHPLDAGCFVLASRFVKISENFIFMLSCPASNKTHNLGYLKYQTETSEKPVFLGIWTSGTHGQCCDVEVTSCLEISITCREGGTRASHRAVGMTAPWGLLGPPRCSPVSSARSCEGHFCSTLLFLHPHTPACSDCAWNENKPRS